jgi:hypothetical protein
MAVSKAVEGRRTQRCSEDAVVIHVHVPKCAGTTIEEHFQQELEDSFWRPGKRSRKLPLELFRAKYDSSSARSPDSVRAVSGHFIGRSIEEMFPARKIIRTIVLRKPCDLLMSWYNFRNMRYIDQGLGPTSIKDFLCSLPPDPITYFMLERWLELSWFDIARLSAYKKVEMVENELARFHSITDISGTDQLIARIGGELGISMTAREKNGTKHWQARTGWKPLKFEHLSSKDQRLLQSRTGLDRHLWDRWCSENRKSAPAPSCSGANKFIANELTRPYFEIRRRLVRNYGRRLRT